jgi:hypothetical protein
VAAISGRGPGQALLRGADWTNVQPAAMTAMQGWPRPQRFERGRISSPPGGRDRASTLGGGMGLHAGCASSVTPPTKSRSELLIWPNNVHGDSPKLERVSLPAVQVILTEL